MKHWEGIWNLIAAQIGKNHYNSEECSSPLSIVFQRSGLLSFNYGFDPCGNLEFDCCANLKKSAKNELVLCLLFLVSFPVHPETEKASTLSRLFQIDAIYSRYANFTLTAFNPLRPSSSSNSTSSFSLILSVRPETWTKYSFFDSSSIMKPNPFVSLKNLTVPLFIIIELIFP